MHALRQVRMRKRILLVFVLFTAASAQAAVPRSAVSVPSNGVIRSREMTSRFTFHARPRRVAVLCEPTTARALLVNHRRVHIPALFENRAANGSVDVYEHNHSTCVAVVNWTAHRVIVHFTLVLLQTTTRLPDHARGTARNLGV